MPTEPKTDGELVADALFDDIPDDRGENGYGLTRYYRTPHGETIRVRMHRDFYVHQSHAVAEVLTRTRVWTDLVHDPASRWHSLTPRLAHALVPGSRRTGMDALRDKGDTLFLDVLNVLDER